MKKGLHYADLMIQTKNLQNLTAIRIISNSKQEWENSFPH
jgi:hypothetical protein